MRVLIVSDMFLSGGLETRLREAVAALSGEHEFFLACSANHNPEGIPSGLEPVDTDIPIGPMSPAVLDEGARRIDKIIREYDIDYVDVHPFVLLAPAALAAAASGTPFGVTLHGPASLYASDDYRSLVLGCLLPWAPAVFVVSDETEALARRYVDPSRIHRVVNGVNADVFAPASPPVEARPGHWAVISRLYPDKMPGILAFLGFAMNGSAESVDVFGEGNDLDALHDWIGDRGWEDRIRLHGAALDIASRLSGGGYELVGSMGRGLLEAGSCNVPTCLVGYDGVKGIVRRERMGELAPRNFSGRGLPNCTAEEFAAQLVELRTSPSTFQLRRWVVSHRNSPAIWREYDQAIRAVSPVTTMPASAMIDVIRAHAGLPANETSMPAMVAEMAAVIATHCTADPRDTVNWQVILDDCLACLRKTPPVRREQDHELRDRYDCARQELVAMRERLVTESETSRAEHAEMAGRLQETEAARQELARTQERLIAEGEGLRAEQAETARRLTEAEAGRQELARTGERLIAEGEGLRAEQAEMARRLAETETARQQLAQTRERLIAESEELRAEQAETARRLQDAETRLVAAAKDRAELHDIKRSRSYRFVAKLNGLRSRLGLRRHRRPLPSARPAVTSAPCVEIRPQPPAPPSAGRLRIGVIMDPFTRICLEPEAELVGFTPDNFREVLSQSPVDFVFIESAWHGNDDAWRYRIADYEARRGGLDGLLGFCRHQGVPSVFWNKEDPPHFNDFLLAAKKTDHVFTTDTDCIPLYREACGHDRIFGLPFAAQPMVHSPILTQPREERICFAGTYHADKFDHRQLDVEMVLRPAIELGLTIYDRMYGTTGASADRYRYPAIFQECIAGKLSYEEMVQAYKHFRIFLNVNSVKTSPTMLSRRVFELLASGTPVVSAASEAIRNLFGDDLVLMGETSDEIREHLQRLLSDEAEWARLSCRGVRSILQRHTYRHRLETICGKIGLTLPGETPATVVAVVNARSPELAGRLARELAGQTRKPSQTIFVTPSEMREAVRAKLAGAFGPAEILAPGELAACIHSLPSDAFVAVMDSVDRYGPHYLADAAEALKHFRLRAVGRAAWFQPTSAGVMLHNAEREHCIVREIRGATLVARLGAIEMETLHAALRGEMVSVEGAYSPSRFGYLHAAGSRSVDAVGEEMFST